MEYNILKLVRRLKLWVVILAILNITIISTIGVNRYLTKKREAAASIQGSGINKFFVNYLDLNETQELELDSIYIDYRNNQKEVGIRLKDVKERLNSAGVDNDSAVMNKIYDDFIAAQALNRDLTIELYKDIRNICSPTQVNKFNYIISQIIISEDHLN